MSPGKTSSPVPLFLVAANLCKLCIRVLRFDPECDNCTYQPLNTNIVLTRRTGNRDLHNHSQLAIHLRQPPSINATINAISQDPPSIHTISQEENSGAAHSLSAQICPFMRHASYSNAEHRRSDSVFNEGSCFVFCCLLL
ncbi:hypothetical protein Tco_1298845 [Tanacetum coccineum]